MYVMFKLVFLLSFQICFVYLFHLNPLVQVSDLNFFDTLGTGLEQLQNSYMRKKYFIFTYIYKVLLSNWF